MRWILKRQIIDVLSKKLKGNMDLVNYILNFNDNSKEIINWYIEKDFYNWLTYDMCLRDELVLSNPAYLDYRYVSKLNYYIKFYKELGLTEYKFKKGDSLVRIKSLTDCFNSQWWKYTQKNFIEWELIHNHIKLTII
tara:strand:+ start:3741 stop:4151 length:411 start_codon:yes stop_codon:yes gene_type:complete